MRRREALAAAAALAGSPAGCLEALQREDAWRQLVVDPPDGVYVPPHVDGTASYGTETADGREISLSASRPHSFWVLTGSERNRADVRSHHDCHLMVAVRDAETGGFVPAPVRTTVRTRSEGSGDSTDRVDERSLWPMLSQRMGPHYGDNVSLADDGPYVATIRVGAANADVTDARSDALERATSVDVEFAFDTDEIESLERRLIDADEGRGDAAALEPMDHAAGRGGTADRDGRDGGSTDAFATATSGDVDYAAALVGEWNGTAERTLAVTARTAYNAYPLPFASLSATIVRDGERIASAPLRETLDGRVGHCYGASVDPDALDAGDELTIGLETPPQVARHEGYETAFLEGEAVTMALDAR